MNYLGIHWVVFAGLLVVNAVAACVIGFLLLRRPVKPGIRSMTLMLFGLAIWSFAYAMITVSPALEAKHFWLKVENVGILSVPVLWFFFALKYARLDNWLTRKPAQALFWVIPCVSFFFLISDNLFHFYYASTRVATELGGPLVITRGPMYLIAFLHAYSLILIGLAVLVWRFIRSRHSYRRQTPYLLGAVLVPFAINIVYQWNPGVFPFFPAPIDLTPLAFTATAILLSAGIFGLQMFDLLPIARDTVLEHMPEVVFVLDAHDRVMDANIMAQNWLGKRIDEIMGRDALEVFRDWPQLLNRFLLTEHSREEIEIPGNPSRVIEIVVTPIHNRAGSLEGRVIVAYDVTERKLLENKLKALNLSLREQLDENERLRLQLQEQAIRDPLTGVFNRRFFAEALDREDARARRDRTPYSILIMDVDHFKNVNDTYGHKCGDVVLRNLAEFLIGHTRRSDIVCRYGGEEFVILMPDAQPQAARERAEFLRSRFEAMTIDCGGAKLNSTVSVGIASCPDHSESAEILLMFADQALYRSKSTGRNRVSMYSPDIRYDIPLN